MLTEIVSKSSLIPDLSGLKIYPALLESILEKASLSSKNPGSNSVWQNPLLQENQHFKDCWTCISFYPYTPIFHG